MVRHIRSGGPFEDKIGYSRAVVAGGFVHVSGTCAQGDAVDGDVVAQCTSALSIIQAALEEAGSSLDQVVRVTYMLPDPSEFEPCWPVLAKAFASARPAATMISCQLIDPKYRIEIEVTALAPGNA